MKYLVIMLKIGFNLEYCHTNFNYLIGEYDFYMHLFNYLEGPLHINEHQYEITSV